LDAHKISAISVQRTDGKIVERANGWKRGSVPFTAERAELVAKPCNHNVARNHSGRHNFALHPERRQAVTLTTPRRCRQKRNRQARWQSRELAKLTKMVEFTFIEIKT
jgi:hypothetical protein